MIESPEVHAAWLAECAKADIEMGLKEPRLNRPRKKRTSKAEMEKLTDEEKLARKHEYYKNYRVKNKGKLNAQARALYAKLPVKPKHKFNNVYHDPDYHKKYAESHKEQIREYNRRYQAKKRAASSLQTESGVQQ